MEDSKSSSVNDFDHISEEQQANVRDKMEQCISMFASAQSDSDKLASLFILPKVVQADQLVQDEELASQLLHAMGEDFLRRLLSQGTEDKSEDSKLYESVALSLLSNFPSSVLATNKCVIEAIPRLTNMVAPNKASSDDMSNDVDLATWRDAFVILKGLAKGGRAQALMDADNFLDNLVNLIVNETIHCDEAFELLITVFLNNKAHKDCTSAQIQSINRLLNSMTSAFAIAEDPFELCEKISTLISTLAPLKTETLSSQDWLNNLKSGLRNILMSKIGQQQRIQALSLVANIILTQNQSLNFALDSQDSNRFLATVVNVACVELIVLMDEQREIKDEEVSVLGACFCIIEAALVVVQDGENELDDSKRLQMASALKNALMALCKFLVQIHKNEDNKYSQAFVTSVHRLLIVGLAEEGLLPLSADTVEALKPVWKTSCKTFEMQKASTIHQLGKARVEDSGQQEQPDLLRLLLPALCHLVTESEPRRVLLNELRVHETLSIYLTYHLTLILKCKQLLPRERLERAAISEETDRISSEGGQSYGVLLQETDSRFALITLCNIFMNICMDQKEDEDVVNKSSTFFIVLRTLFNALSNLDSSNEDDLELYGHFCVLALLLLKHHTSRRPKPTDASVYKFAQAVIRFLWDAHNCEESSSPDTLVVSQVYKSNWNEGLSDLWYLSMQTLCSLMSEKDLSWMAEFVWESGFASEVLNILKCVRSTGIESSTKLAFEDLLVSLLNADVDDREEIVEALSGGNVVDVCRKHQLKHLAKNVAKMEKGSNI